MTYIYQFEIKDYKTVNLVNGNILWDFITPKFNNLSHSLEESTEELKIKLIIDKQNKTAYLRIDNEQTKEPLD